jgi:hypothetical protein
MDSIERVAIIEQGIAALRLIEAERRAQLPPPERDDAARVRELRAVETIASQLEDAIGGGGYDPVSVRARDAWLSMHFDEPDALFVLELADDRGAGTPYRIGPLPSEHQGALRALGNLMQRYLDGEYMPPHSWFGIGSEEP